MDKRTIKKYKKYRRYFKEVKKYMLLRILGVFGLSLVFSAGYVLFDEIGIKKSVMLLLCVLGFLIGDIVFMRRSYYRFAHRRKYIMAEGIPHGIYAIVSIAVARFLPDSGIYEMFGVTDIFEFAVYDLTPFVSAVVFNVILFLAIRFVPISMKWLHISHG